MALDEFGAWDGLSRCAAKRAQLLRRESVDAGFRALEKNGLPNANAGVTFGAGSNRHSFTNRLCGQGNDSLGRRAKR